MSLQVLSPSLLDARIGINAESEFAGGVFQQPHLIDGLPAADARPGSNAGSEFAGSVFQQPYLASRRAKLAWVIVMRSVDDVLDVAVVAGR